MDNPFIPKDKASLAIISGMASDEIVYNLHRKNLIVIKSIGLEEVGPEIAYHPDMAIHPIGENTLVVAPSVFDYYKTRLVPYGIKVIKGKSKLGKEYPNDIAYNTILIGNHYVHKKTYTEKTIEEFYKQSNISLVEVKQGYAKCSISLVDEKSAITGDLGIAKKLRALNYDILLIKSGKINLPGYPYGFIGGSSGHISPKEIVFTGSLDKHPNKGEIESFIRARGIGINYLSKESIIDLGTIFTFNI